MKSSNIPLQSWIPKERTICYDRHVMKNPFTFTSRVRYSEVDADRELSLVSVLNYFQDCSTFQSEDLDIGLVYLRDRHLFWVINSWQIDVLRYPVLGERITLGTQPYELKGFMGLRNFMMWDEQDQLVVKANSVWSLLDTETYRPMKCTQEILEKYTIAEKIDMEYLPRKIALPEHMEEKDELVIGQHHLDTNQHVNNGRFVEMASDYMTEKGKCRRLRVEYLKSAFKGDVLTPLVAEDPQITYVCFKNQNGDKNAVFTFER